MYGTTHNARLVRLRIKGTTSPQTGRGRSARGEASYSDHDLLTATDFVLMTWVNFNIERKIQAQGIDSEVVGEWEITHHVQEIIHGLIGRHLDEGDQVGFDTLLGKGEQSTDDTRPELFFLTKVEVSAGIFETVSMQKFNLVRSWKGA